MKLIPIVLLASAAFATSSARANHVSFRGFFRFGGPAYCAPAPDYCAPRPVYVEPPVYCPPRVYCPPPAYCPPADYCPPVVDTPTYVAPPTGYWQCQTVNIWVPARWVTSYDAYGCARTYVVPAHYEAQTRRVWVNSSCG